MPLILTSAGGFGVLDQDTPVEITNSLALLLDTRPGERRCVPEYGLPDPLGRGVDPIEVAELIEEWEPRADPADLELEALIAAEEHLTVRPAAFNQTETEANTDAL